MINLFCCYFYYYYGKIVENMAWGDVSNWVMHGGSFLGTQKQLPDKIMDKVADAFKKYNFHGLLLVGGFEVRISKLFVINVADFSHSYVSQVIMIN